MSKDWQAKIADFAESTLDAILALTALVIDAGFWLAWAYLTKWSGDLISSQSIEGFEELPYRVAQWTGSGVLVIFVVFRTAKDLISLWDSFVEYLRERKK